MRSEHLLTILCVAALPNAGLAEPYSAREWRTGAFEIRSDETESDAFLRAVCVAPDRLDLRIGADFTIGEGKFDRVTVEFVSGQKKAVLTGVSVESPDVEMTGGMELLTGVKTNDPVFDVLTQAKPFTLQAKGGDKHTVNLGKKAGSLLKTFLQKCKDGVDW